MCTKIALSITFFVVRSNDAGEVNVTILLKCYVWFSMGGRMILTAGNLQVHVVLRNVEYSSTSEEYPRFYSCVFCLDKINHQ